MKFKLSILQKLCYLNDVKILNTAQNNIYHENYCIKIIMVTVLFYTSLKFRYDINVCNLAFFPFKMKITELYSYDAYFSSTEEDFLIS